MALWRTESLMNTLPQFVGTIHIFLGPYRGTPIALYLQQEGESCRISPTIYPWNKFVGIGETVNKAAADFDLKWKEGDLAPEVYSGPHWEGGIKPEKPKPPPKPSATKPEGVSASPNPPSTPPSRTEDGVSPPQPPISSEPNSTTNPAPSEQAADKPIT